MGAREYTTDERAVVLEDQEGFGQVSAEYYARKYDQGKEMPLQWSEELWAERWDALFEAGHLLEAAALCALRNDGFAAAEESIEALQEHGYEAFQVARYGAKKYSWDSWNEVPDGVSRYANAACRHLFAVLIEPVDAETGRPHQAHALCDLWFVRALTSGEV